jgi:hypothetical protein
MTARLLALLCGLLAVTMAAEATRWFGADGPAQQGPAEPRRAASQATTQLVRPEGSLNRSMAVVLARPLFAPDRKPIPGTVAADPGMPRLAGIIASPNAAVAIFQPVGDGKTVVARHGERVGGWEVTAITADEVDLRKENDVIALSPRFDGIGHEGVTTKEARKPPTRWEAPAPTGLLRARWSNAQLQP